MLLVDAEVGRELEAVLIWQSLNQDPHLIGDEQVAIFIQLDVDE